MGVLTDGSFYNKDVSLLIGDYTLEPAPAGFIWSPTNITVVGTDFNAGNNYTYTISFALIPDPTLPVELSSFTATTTAQNFVNLTWVSQSETGLLGYRVYRNESLNQATAVTITPALIAATNTSTSHSYNYIDTEVTIGNTYYYWLESVDMNHTTFHGPVTVTVEGEVPPVLPEYTAMRSAYPNPFRMNGSTNIEVSMKAGETGTVTIYNVLGQVVKTFNTREGINQLTWNGHDVKGNACSSGIYFYKLSSPSVNKTLKMVIVK
jgi:fibronectin type 3 domain-containing protein